MRISDWSSDVCSSDLRDVGQIFSLMSEFYSTAANRLDPHGRLLTPDMRAALEKNAHDSLLEMHSILKAWLSGDVDGTPTGSAPRRDRKRSEEHTSELQSLMRISYAVFCLKKKKI